MARKKDLVCSAFSDLLVNEKFDYITTGVPPRVLEMKIAHELTQLDGDGDFENVKKRAQDLIKQELKKETLVMSSGGNYLAGPASGKNDDDSNDVDDDADEYEDEEDDEEEDDGESKHAGDSDYSPSYVTGRRMPQRRGEGRVSARQKKSRFDAEDYVFPNKLKNFMKHTSPGTSPTKAKVPRKRPGPKPKKRTPPTTCSICRNPNANEEVSVPCKSCPVKAHESCVGKELKGKSNSEWICLHCTPRPNTKWKCAVCGNPPGREFGVLVSCESCALQYHKQCHSPPIPETRKLLNSWRCSNCPLVQRAKSPVVAKAKRSAASTPAVSPERVESPTQGSDSSPAHKKFLNGTACYKCKGDFPNANDKATCSNCKLSFHARCCRAKEVANLTRLGTRKTKWRCDSCKLQKGRPIKKEPVSEDEIRPSPDDSMDVDEPRSVESEDDKVKDDWWKARLRPIKIGANQPPLGPIPDFTVPDIASWSAADVQDYFDDFFLDRKIGMVFVEHEIDGKALKLMRRNDIISTFDYAGFGLDVILDIILHVKRLQLRVNDRRYIWADIM